MASLTGLCQSVVLSHPGDCGVGGKNLQAEQSCSSGHRHRSDSASPPVPEPVTATPCQAAKVISPLWVTRPAATADCPAVAQ